jgi:hypothetical protein
VVVSITASTLDALIIFPLRLLCSPVEGAKLQNIICDGGVLVP